MLVKPATPLTVILFVCFALLLLSVLSTPVIKGIPIATFEETSFGVFGYCRGTECSGFRVGYGGDGTFADAGNNNQFNLPSSIRASLSSLLVVHPVAAFLNLVCLCLAGAAHFHAPSHSPRYLLGLLILLLPTLLVSLLAFLVDILLFVPHLQWGGWIVLAATILLTASGVMTCAMRRTLVSRKARKRRIAENAEMSGENFYNRQNAIKLDPTNNATVTTISADPVGPSNSGFATFDSRTRSPDNDLRPLNSQSPPPGFVTDNSSPYATPGESSRFTPSPLPPPVERLPYGAPGAPYGLPSDPRLREQRSAGSMGSQRRAGGGPYGPPRGRGGSMRGRGGPYPGGPRGPPPQGYYGRGGPPRGGPVARGRMPPPGYPPNNGDGYGGGYGPGGRGAPRMGDAYGPRGPAPMRRPSPGAPGQDIEMEPPNRLGAGGDVGRRPSPGVPGHIPSPTSVYSQEAYVPPRSNWNREPTLPNIGVPPTGRSGSSQGYVEDVEPRFAQPAPADSSDNIPPSLNPGPHATSLPYPNAV